jgi:hypothetical protein
MLKKGLTIHVGTARQEEYVETCSRCHMKNYACTIVQSFFPAALSKALHIKPLLRARYVVAVRAFKF